MGKAAPFAEFVAQYRQLQAAAIGEPLTVSTLEALHDGWSQGKLSMDALWRYATVDRVATVMRPYLESVTA